MPKATYERATFRARFPGWCRECDTHYYENTLVAYDGNDDVVHAKCPEPREEPVGDVCARCFLVVTQSGACGCDA